MADLSDRYRADCAECNSSLLDAAISYEAAMYQRVLAHCRAMADKCSQTRHDFRNHMAEQRGDSQL
jgi:hypothetical protein